MNIAPLPGITFTNARLSDGRLGSLRIQGGRICTLGAAPRRGDQVIDIEGDRLLPGLINAHDHLQLNNVPPHHPAAKYRHVQDWIGEITARRQSDRRFSSEIAVPRDERLLIGGIKNLLSGVTTVAHHDPLYELLREPLFPTQVMQRYGWSHSLYVDGDAAVSESQRQTPADSPWIIHACEGVNAQARLEFDRLESLGCIQPNTLLVHGIALDGAQRERLVLAGAGLIWCPSSNLNLFGRTAHIQSLARSGRVALGTDSRLSGAADLLREMRIAARAGGFSGDELLPLVTRQSASLLRLRDRGDLTPGSRADLIILPSGTCLTTAGRCDLRLVMIGGEFRYGDADLAHRTMPKARQADIMVDGRRKILDARIAAAMGRLTRREPGLEILAAECSV